MIDKTEMRTISTIHLCLVDNVLFNVIDKDLALVLWERLEKFYMGKSLTNKLYLKWQLIVVPLTGIDCSEERCSTAQV